MKKLMLLIAALLFGFAVMGQEASAHRQKQKKNKKEVYQYCAKIKDGLLVMTKDEKEMTTDELLPNGTQIKTDGTVIRTDGTVTILEDGECVDQMGNVYPARTKGRPTKNQANKKEIEIAPPEDK